MCACVCECVPLKASGNSSLKSSPIVCYEKAVRMGVRGRLPAVAWSVHDKVQVAPNVGITSAGCQVN